MELAYMSVIDTEMRMGLCSANLGRHIRMLENNMIKDIRKRARRVHSIWN
jgi:hypothetical protein